MALYFGVIKELRLYKFKQDYLLSGMTKANETLHVDVDRSYIALKFTNYTLSCKIKIYYYNWELRLISGYSLHAYKNSLIIENVYRGTLEFLYVWTK